MGRPLWSAPRGAASARGARQGAAPGAPSSADRGASRALERPNARPCEAGKAQVVFFLVGSEWFPPGKLVVVFPLNRGSGLVGRESTSGSAKCTCHVSSFSTRGGLQVALRCGFLQKGPEVFFCGRRRFGSHVHSCAIVNVRGTSLHVTRDPDECDRVSLPGSWRAMPTWSWGFFPTVYQKFVNHGLSFLVDSLCKYIVSAGMSQKGLVTLSLPWKPPEDLLGKSSSRIPQVACM